MLVVRDAYLIAVTFYILGIVADLLFCLPVQTRWTGSDQILSVVAKKILAAVRVMGAVFSRCGTGSRHLKIRKTSGIAILR